MLSISKWLSEKPQWFLGIYAGLIAFAAYSCMYLFRKPFTAVDYNTVESYKVSYKVWLVVAQVLGYMCSKFYGIKFIAQLKNTSRLKIIMLLITVAWLALLLFAIVPNSVKPLCLFLNGLPLGMIWGVVFSYLEGRRTTEIMGAVLASSFIFASGFAKAIGKWLIIDLQVPEFWMPFAAGSIFILPMFVFSYFLNAISNPTKEDVACRTERKAMSKAEQKSFINQFLPGLIFIVAAYILVTILRDVRDNFMNEIWVDLGQPTNASSFTKTEIPVTLLVLFITAILVLVKQNKKAFMLTHVILVVGMALALLSTFAFSLQIISPYWWMLLTGTGLYMSYIPINCIFFERMLATFKVTANVGFVMYIADSFGYLGSVLILFVKEFSGVHLAWATFYMNTIFIAGLCSLLLFAASAYYFKNKKLNSI